MAKTSLRNSWTGSVNEGLYDSGGKLNQSYIS